MAQMDSVFIELERAMIRERTRSAMSVKRSRGERISGHAPYGWDFGPGGRLVQNASEQKIITRMRRMQAEGLSTGELLCGWTTRALGRSGVDGGFTRLSRASWRGTLPSGADPHLICFRS
jgi:DNA invertase Pin-like site-specific DNA recombinase